MWNLFSQFGIRVKALQSFKSILIVFPNTSSQKYKLYNTFLFKLTAHILYFLPKPPEIHKCMVRHLTTPHFLEACGHEMLL